MTEGGNALAEEDESEPDGLTRMVAATDSCPAAEDIHGNADAVALSAEHREERAWGEEDHVYHTVKVK